ncbi:hypothetical protein PIB30_003488 [Stylosanthes scabra]|uniref:Uncharacterized protein n=1 Tax=Stylosanthes scabra TaxID=79078 RepID=A0ABU6V5A2_9FABA|nr:hypothetical protein [Stylosanthes scabra]
MELLLLTLHLLLFPFTTSQQQNQNYYPSSVTLRNDTYCDYPSVCGPNGNCDINQSPACFCLDGFTPKSPTGYSSMDYTQGCVRKIALNCSTDVFVAYSVFKEPSGNYTLLNQSLGDDGCKGKCKSNCSCTGYSVTTGGGCKFWSGDLCDVRLVKDGGQVLYIRMSASDENESGWGNQSNHKKIVGIIVGSTVAAIFGMIMILACCYMLRKRRTKLADISLRTSDEIADQLNGYEEGDIELPFLDLSRIVEATDNFSMENKLGEGGFGPVYKGTFDDGRQIAVKKLSSSSGQGIKEFKNEVLLIAKLQHHQIRQKLLDWPKRFNIICGISRGLLYLHEDSRLRIIHRDLKASNILLDSEMDPKISDFGLARCFGGDQSKANTKKIVGTFGYMAPEYAISGHFSVKSDVFSFGILLLEIITGRKNRGIYFPSDNVNLYGHAWDLWKQGRCLELVDEWLKESWNSSEAQRCIHICLLCAQQHPQDRPDMSSVVLMLGSEIDLPQPKFPTFIIGGNSDGRSSSSCQNEISITEVAPR